MILIQPHCLQGMGTNDHLLPLGNWLCLLSRSSTCPGYWLPHFGQLVSTNIDEILAGVSFYQHEITVKKSAYKIQWSLPKKWYTHTYIYQFHGFPFQRTFLLIHLIMNPKNAYSLHKKTFSSVSWRQLCLIVIKRDISCLIVMNRDFIVLVINVIQSQPIVLTIGFNLWIFYFMLV